MADRHMKKMFIVITHQGDSNQNTASLLVDLQNACSVLLEYTDRKKCYYLNQYWLNYISFKFTKSFDHVNTLLGPLPSIARELCTEGILKLHIHLHHSKSTYASLPFLLSTCTTGFPRRGQHRSTFESLYVKDVFIPPLHLIIIGSL